MTTVINNPGDNGNGNGESAGAGVVIGAVIAILVVVAVLLYSLPYIRNQFDATNNPNNTTIKVEVPVPTTNSPAPTK